MALETECPDWSCIRPGMACRAAPELPDSQSMMCMAAAGNVAGCSTAAGALLDFAGTPGRQGRPDFGIAMVVADTDISTALALAAGRKVLPVRATQDQTGACLGFLGTAGTPGTGVLTRTERPDSCCVPDPCSLCDRNSPSSSTK